MSCNEKINLNNLKQELSDIKETYGLRSLFYLIVAVISMFCSMLCSISSIFNFGLMCIDGMASRLTVQEALSSRIWISAILIGLSIVFIIISNLTHNWFLDTTNDIEEEEG